MEVKKNYLIFGLIFVVLIIFLFILKFGYTFIRIQTQGGLIKLKVEVADSPKEREIGLMNRKYLCSNCGMLFVFEKEGEYKFWMKNTLISLDMIFVDGNKTVVFIEKDAKPCISDSCEVYPKEEVKFRYVVEVNSGFSERNKIYVGDRVLF